jgi:hypothetical protein
MSTVWKWDGEWLYVDEWNDPWSNYNAMLCKKWKFF